MMVSVDKLIQRGNKAFEMQDFRKASKFFKKILEINNENIEALQKFAVCNCFMGKVDVGIESFNKALELNPDKETELDIFSNLANALMFKGNETGNDEFYDKAIKINKKIMNKIEDREGVYLNLGNLYKYKKEFAESINVFKEGLKEYPKSARLMVHLGNALRAKDEELGKTPAEAIEFYKKSKEVDPKYIGGYLNLGLTYFDLGRSELAEKEFLEAYKINPEDPQLLNVMNQLGQIFDK